SGHPCCARSARAGLAEVAGIEPTGRGSPVPLVLKTREATRPRSPPGGTVSGAAGVATLTISAASMLRYDQGRLVPSWRFPVKKLLLLLVLVALGAAVAKKVRTA